MTNTVITVHGVLAGAYLNRGKSNPRTMLSHASINDGETSLCGKIKDYRLADISDEPVVTCDACLTRMWRLAGKP